MDRHRGGEVQKVWSIMWGSEGGIKRYLKSEVTSYYFLSNTLIPPIPLQV